jgi:hypothetical protein
MSYSAKAYLITAATACLIAATVFGIARIWWICGLLTLAAVSLFALLLRVASLSTKSERRAAVGVAERGIGSAGRALAGGWQPRSLGANHVVVRPARRRRHIAGAAGKICAMTSCQPLTACAQVRGAEGPFRPSRCGCGKAHHARGHARAG